VKNTHCTLIIGGYVLGYSLVRELYDNDVRDIIIFDFSRRLGAFSSKIKKFVLVKNTLESLYESLCQLHEEYERIIVYASDDICIEILDSLYEKISSFCFLPFNHGNVYSMLDKRNQYDLCKKLGIPYPKTVFIKSIDDVDKLFSVKLPVLIKPNRKIYFGPEIFKNFCIHNQKDLLDRAETMKKYIGDGICFLVSEIIPGDASNIHAYVGYRNTRGETLNEWTGGKLSQYPDNYGVFSTVSNYAPPQILELGRLVLNEMDIHGIAEAEFKYDSRDCKHKFIEVNLRPMMWNRLGYLSGVDVAYTQYLDALGKKVIKKKQEKEKSIHYVYLNYEISNLFRRRGYIRKFYKNLFESDKTSLAVWDKSDMKPFIIDFFGYLFRGAVELIFGGVRGSDLCDKIKEFYDNLCSGSKKKRGSS